MEILDLYNVNGEKLNKTIIRGEKSGKDEYIKLTVVYLKCNERYLIQKCSKEKGGVYAVTGGHVSSGNTSSLQACIEVEEELGINIKEDKLRFLGNIYRNSAMFDIYLYEDNDLINCSFILQESEVERVEWLTKLQIEELIEKGLVRESSCQHFEKFIK